tara:strand:+ start:249 stop:473 length:225 start_codon:yes stop_codon:yes gene_type:complete
MSFLEKLIIKIFSKKIIKIETLKKYDIEGNTLEVIFIIHYKLFWLSVKEIFSKNEYMSDKDLHSFRLYIECIAK